MESVWNWLLPLISGIVGALIGTYGGSSLLYWRQEKKIKSVRNIALRALAIFDEYAKQNKTYADAENEFNTKLNISGKRAIVVALHKIGVPFEMPTKEALDIKNLKFKSTLIDKDEIGNMKQQIEKGNCDNQFYVDVESYFTANLRLNAIRNIGKRYVTDVLEKSHIDKDNPNLINNPFNWWSSFSQGELQTILVLRDLLVGWNYFSADGAPDKVKTQKLIKEIEIGLWDNYLFWDYESFANVRAQHNLADTIQKNLFPMGQQVINVNNSQALPEKRSN